MISNTTKLKGLYTFGNELLQPEGSLIVADNVNIDEPNVISQRRGFTDYADLIDPSSSRIRQLLTYKGVLFRHYSSYLEYFEDNVYKRFSGSYLELDPDIRIKSSLSNGNLYFTTSTSIKKISALSSSEFTTAPKYITDAGVPEALDIFGKTVYSTSGFLPPQSKVAYKVLFGKKDINSNLLLGTPSSRFIVTNNSSDVFTFEKTNLIFKSVEDFKAQYTTLTCGLKNNTNETNPSNTGAVLQVHSANNEYKYAFWFNKGTGSPPSIPGYTNVQVDISALGPSDPVAPVLQAAIIGEGLQDITTSQVGNNIFFQNTIEGSTNGVTSPTGIMITDLGGGWSRIITTLGTDSRYIEKYFVVPTPITDYCFYYGNTRTITTIPDDPLTIGMTFVGIEIPNDGSKAFISNKTSQVLRDTLTDLFQVNLNLSLVNPILTLTNLSGGDSEDIQQGDISIVNMEVVVLNQGTISDGKFSNVEVKFTIPSGIDTSYFYQIYRTSAITVSEGLTISDIDPGEEHNLVYEGSVDQPSGSQITVLDITNEVFRNSGLPLYNNPISGEGILQSNNIPPISKDITLYRGYMFYGNTKINHQQVLSTVTVDDVVSEVSKFKVITTDVERSYTFRGNSTDITLNCSTKANTKTHNLTNPDAKIYLYSALDETKYVIYFDDGTATSPTDTDAVLVKIDIAELLPGDNVAALLELTLRQFSDFTIVRNVDELLIDNSENGISTPPQSTTNNIVADIGTGWALTVNNIGDGEDTSLGYVLISKSASVGIKLEKTIRSLVNVINADILSTVNGYYISSLNDLPGKFLLKSRSIEDKNFFTITDGFSGSDFNPEIATKSSVGFTSITPVGLTKTNLELTAHGFTNNEEVFISVPNAIPAINNTFSVTVLDVNNIQISTLNVGGDTTDSYYFFPFQKSDNLSSPNRIYYSKFNQPEAVPIVNYIDIGTKDEPIERILSLRDYLFVLKTDGIYMVSGESGFFTVRMIDTEKILCPDSAVVLNNQIYMLANSGIITINENSPMIISRMIEDKFQKLGKFRNNIRRQGFGVSYEDDRAYLLWIPEDSADEVPTQAFRYNILERMWTRWTKSATCGLVVENDKTLMYIGDGERPIVMEERKDLERTDFSDRNFNVSLGLSAYVADRYRISSVDDVEVGDVIIQNQTVNVSEYARLLSKLDLDTGIPYSTFSTDFIINIGDDLSSSLNTLNGILVSLDTSNTITTKLFDNTDWVELQELYNLLMSELNNPSCITSFKNYKDSIGTLSFEYIITNVYPFSNEITTFDPTVFIQGELVIYKQIKSEVQTNPIHFGNPSSFKQISKGYLLFDQNNFFNMRLSYSTDLSKGFEGYIFRGKGTGFWGSSTWGFEDKNYWGGDGNDAPRRVIIPRNKQRCRYITVRFTHNIARDFYKVVGVAHDVREFSTRAYR